VGDLPPERRASWLVPVLSACLVVIVIVIGIVFLTGDDGDSDETTSATSQASAPAESSDPAVTEAAATESDAAPIPTPASASTDTTETETATTDAPTSSACASFTEQSELPIQLCDSGDLVRAAQEGLAAWGSQAGDAVGEITVDVDGFFGPQTEAAVRSFQTIRSLAVDGIIGPNTWAELCPFTNVTCE
jgi:peptidoglycan hydrolase-like protein with peptidoglycan-binding domain